MDEQPTTPSLPERLRARAEGRELNGPMYEADLREAADEIERLRAALEDASAFSPRPFGRKRSA